MWGPHLIARARALLRVKRVAVVMFIALCCPAVAISQTVWVDDPVYPVIVPPGDPGSWDDGNRNPLAVIKVDGVYHLYFNGQPLYAQTFLDFDIGHAWSTDGIVWTMDPENPVLTRGALATWDDGSLWGAAVIYDGSEFKMWYCGLHGDYKRAGLATNTDGYGVWTKYSGNPVMDVGPPGSFDATEVKPGAVIYRDGLFRMWYAGAAAWNGPPALWDWKIGYAWSSDGISWAKLGEPVLSPIGGWESQFVFSPSVLFDGAIYHLWYTGGNLSSLDIGYAVSSDGIGWTRYAGNPVVVSPSADGYEFPNVLVDYAFSNFEMWYHHMVPDTVRRATSECCLEFVFVNGFESGDTIAWSSASAYTHTITIDGINDFSLSGEQFLTTSVGYTAYVTWDSQYLFIGLEGSDLGPTSSADKSVLIYIGGAGGTYTGQTYNSQVPALAFESKYHIRWRTDGGYTNAQVWNASWTDAGWDFSGDVARVGDFLEMRLPLVDIGSPPLVRVHISLVNELSGLEWTYAGVPATSFIDGFDPDYGHYFEFDHNSNQAPSSYPPM